MNLIWHLVRKDLLRARWLVVGSLGLSLIPILVGGWVMAGGDDFMGVTVPFRAAYQPILMMLQVVIVFPIVAWLVHEDRLVGSTMHWPVLPISGGHLLIAKTCSLLLMLWVLPLLISLPWWLWNGFGGKEIFDAILYRGIILFPALAIALMLGSLTESMARFFIGCLVFYVAFAFFAGAYIPRQVQPDGTLLPVDVYASRSMLGLLVAVTTVMIVVIHQFLRRRRGVSLCLLAGGGSLVALIAVGWRWSLFTPTPPETDNVAATNSAVVIDWSEPTVRRARIGGRPPEVAWMRFENEATITGLKPGELWTGRITSLRFEWKDGTVAAFEPLTGGKASNRVGVSGRFVENESAAANIFPERDRVVLALNAEISSDVIARMAEEAPAVSAVVEGYVHRGEILADIPLAKSGFAGGGAHRVAIFESERRGPIDHRLVIAFVEPAPPPWRRVTAPARPGTFPLFGVRGGGVFNRSDREEVRQAGRWGQLLSTRTVLGHYAGVAISRQSRTAMPPRILPGGRNISSELPHGMDERWLDDAHLVWTRAVLVGRHDSAFHVERLRLPSSFFRPISLPSDGPGEPETVAWPPDSTAEPGR